ncbi:MAG: bacteriophage holin [Tatlockia sp.]|jgi:hypothetical protein
MTKLKLHPVALGMSLGIIWGVSILLMGLIAAYFSYGKTFVTAVGGLYIGYQPTIAGSFIGGLIGFIDAFIGGLIIAWLYNMFSCHECKK